MTPIERARAVISASSDLFTLPVDRLSLEERIMYAIREALEESAQLAESAVAASPASIAFAIRRLMEEKP